MPPDQLAFQVHAHAVKKLAGSYRRLVNQTNSVTGGLACKPIREVLAESAGQHRAILRSTFRRDRLSLEQARVRRHLKAQYISVLRRQSLIEVQAGASRKLAARDAGVEAEVQDFDVAPLMGQGGLKIKYHLTTPEDSETTKELVAAKASGFTAVSNYTAEMFRRTVTDPESCNGLVEAETKDFAVIDERAKPREMARTTTESLARMGHQGESSYTAGGVVKKYIRGKLESSASDNPPGQDRLYRRIRKASLRKICITRANYCYAFTRAKRRVGPGRVEDASKDRLLAGNVTSATDRPSRQARQTALIRKILAFPVTNHGAHPSVMESEAFRKISASTLEDEIIARVPDDAVDKATESVDVRDKTGRPRRRVRGVAVRRVPNVAVRRVSNVAVRRV